MNAPTTARPVEPGYAHPTFCHAYGTGSLCGHHDGRPTTITATAAAQLVDNTLENVGRVESSPILTDQGAYGTNLLVVDEDGREVEVKLTPQEARKLAVALIRDAEVAEQEEKLLLRFTGRVS